MLQPPQGHATSTVPKMTVAEVRRALSRLREMWIMSTPEQPLFICDKIYNDKSIAEFAKEFVFGHHLKRHFKSVLQANINNKVKNKNTASAAAPSLTSHLLPCETQSTRTTPMITAIPGPKGDVHDPFPFTSTWKPRTVRGKHAFDKAAAMKVTAPSEQPSPPPPAACPASTPQPVAPPPTRRSTRRSTQH